MGLREQLKNINNAEGVREIVRRSYDESFNLIVRTGLAQGASEVSGDTLSETAQYFSLFDVMEDYYLASGIENVEKSLYCSPLRNRPKYGSIS